MISMLKTVDPFLADDKTFIRQLVVLDMFACGC